MQVSGKETRAYRHGEFFSAFLIVCVQVEGAEGLERLKERVYDSGPGALYQGSLAQAAATAAGHFPWFLTFNFCECVSLLHTASPLH